MKQNWQIKKLKDICEKGSSNVNMKDLTDLQGEYPIYGASGLIKNVNFYHQEKEYIGIIKDGSGIGRTMLLPPKSSVIGTLQYILPKEGNLIQFINYALQSLDLTKFKQGAAIPHIYFKDYGETEIVVPPLADQRRIVAILDAKFTQIDALKATAQKNLDNAEQLWKAKLEKEFGNKEWKMTKLGEVCEITDGDHLPPPKSESGFPFITISDIDKDAYKIKFDNTFFVPETYFKGLKDNKKPKRGDVLYTVTGSYGIPVLVDGEREFCFQRHIGLIRPIKSINSKFLFYWILNPETKKIADEVATGTAQKTVSLKSLRNFTIPIPPLAEQTAIVSRLDALSAQISELKTKYRRQIECCDELRQSLLRAAFEGEM